MSSTHPEEIPEAPSSGATIMTEEGAQPMKADANSEPGPQADSAAQVKAELHQDQPGSRKRSLDAISTASGDGVLDTPPELKKGNTESDPAGKKPRLDSAHGEASPDSLEEGELSDSEPENMPAQPNTPPKQGLNGWNRGITVGLRTSFGGAGLAALKPKATKPPVPAETATSDFVIDLTSSKTIAATPSSSEPDSTDEKSSGDDPLEASKRQAQNESSSSIPSKKPLQPSLLNRAGISWVLPALEDPENTNGLTWQVRFEKWSRDFLATNQANVYVATPSLVTDAFTHYIEKCSGFAKKKRKTAKMAASAPAAEEKLLDMIKNPTAVAQPPNEADATGEMSGSTRQEPSAGEPASLMGNDDSDLNIVATTDGTSTKATASQGHTEKGLRDLHKYYVGLPDNAPFCVYCARPGHFESVCPEKTCKFCQSKEHPGAYCPGRSRCTKCKAIGHVKENCPEKLASAPGEVSLQCAQCNLPDHLEADCLELWRSFRPRPEDTKKVKFIPMFCCECGREGHYFTDCSINTGQSFPGSRWTSANHDKFVDPGCDNLAISWGASLPAGPDPLPGRPDFGHSIAPRTHVYFSESDDEEDGNFVRAPVRRPRAQGRINIATNIDTGYIDNNRSANRNVGGNNGQRDNPPARRTGPSLRNDDRFPTQPLPPRPPPPMPPRRDGMSGGGYYNLRRNDRPEQQQQASGQDRPVPWRGFPGQTRGGSQDGSSNGPARSRRGARGRGRGRP